MKSKNVMTRWIPYLVAVAAFLILTMLYFAPQFRGEVLPQHDVMQYEGMGRDIIEHQKSYGEDPQWAGRMFSGMPAYLINVKYEGTVIRTLSKAFYFLGRPAALIFLAMAGFFLMLLCLGINPWVGMVPSLAYGLSTYFFIIIGAGHVTKMMALAFAPMMMAGIFYAYRRNMWIGAGLTAFFGSVLIGANHPQVTYYFLIVVAVYWINSLIVSIREKVLPRFAKVTGLLVLAAVLASGSNAGMLYYIQSHGPETMRGGSELTSASDTDRRKGLELDYATNWSYGVGETFDLLIPNLYGGASDRGFSADGEVARALDPYNARHLAAQLPGYWGPQPSTAGPVYIGVLIFFVAVLGLFVLRGRSKWWLAVLCILAVLLAWGRYFMGVTEFFYHYFPLYNKFRTVSMILVIVEWCVPLLAALVLQEMWTGDIPHRRLRQGIKYATGIMGGITLFFLLFGGSVLSFTGPFDAQMQLPQDVAAAMRSERVSMMKADALRSLVFVLLAAGVAWMYAGKKLSRGIFIALTACLVIVDMVPVNARYLSWGRFVGKEQNRIKPTEADLTILEDKEPGFRVVNLSVSPFQDATTSYFHRSVGGYHGAKLRRYQDLIERHLGRMNMGVYNMLNTKYFIVRNEQTNALEVQLNSHTNGAAWFVQRVNRVDTPDAEIAMLDTLDTRRAAVVDRRFTDCLDGIQPSGDTTARITLTDYRANRLQYTYTASDSGIAVFSEIYYDKGWKAYLDGEEVPCFRANYVLRAMALPAGEHQVEFRFRAPHYGTLTAITWICSLLILAGLATTAILSIVRCRRQKALQDGER